MRAAVAERGVAQGRIVYMQVRTQLLTLHRQFAKQVATYLQGGPSCGCCTTPSLRDGNPGFIEGPSALSSLENPCRRWRVMHVMQASCRRFDAGAQGKIDRYAPLAQGAATIAASFRLAVGSEGRNPN